MNDFKIRTIGLRKAKGMGTSNNYHFDNQINSCIFV